MTQYGLKNKELFCTNYNAESMDANILHVNKNGSDSNTGTVGSPFLTIGHANTIAISMLNPVTDWDEAVIIKVGPGKYTEHLTEGHRRIYIVGGTMDFEHWPHDVIIYNTGVSEDYYPFAMDTGLNLIGLSVQVDNGEVFGKLVNRCSCSVCSFEGGEWIENTSTDGLSNYFNHCTFQGNGFNLTGTMSGTGARFIGLRNCDIWGGTETTFGSTCANCSTIKLEKTKVANNCKIEGNWNYLALWGEHYSSLATPVRQLSFDTDGYIDIFATSIIGGMHFYSDTPETKKVVNCLFKETPTGEGDITADVPVEFIEYSGNHQHNGINGEVITVSKIKNVGGGQNNYRNIHEALKGSLLTDTIVNLEGDVTVSGILEINPNITVQIDGNSKWSLTSTATNLAILEDNQQLSFVNMKQILGGKQTAVSGSGATLSFVGCGKYNNPCYTNVVVASGDTSSFVYVDKSTIFGTNAPAMQIDDINTYIYIDKALITGASGEPAVEWSVDADNRFRAKYSTMLHGDGGGNSPLVNTDGGDITLAIYNCALNHAFPTADFTNSISAQPNNSVDPDITY